MMLDGTTGYFPNPSEAAVADTWHGPYDVLGDPHPDDNTHTSWHSQISSVFKVQRSFILRYQFLDFVSSYRYNNNR